MYLIIYRVWWGHKGRFIGFFSQHRPFVFPKNEESAGPATLPYDITEVSVLFQIMHYILYEIWRVELDLKGFVFIAGSPCPCQSKKCQTENPDQGQHKVPTCGGL